MAHVIPSKEPLEQQPADEVLGELTQDWPERWLERGEVLWHQDDEADELAYVEDGELEILVSGHAISSAIVGEIIGEASAFMPVAARTATVRAKAPTTVKTCSRDQLRALREAADPAYDLLLNRALRVLADRVSRSGKRLARLAEGMEPRPDRERAPAPPPAPSSDVRLKHHAARTALRMIESLESLSDGDLSELARATRSITLEPGESLCLEGDTRRSAYLLGDGRLRIVRNVGSHKAVPVTTVDRGALLGLLGLLLGTPRNASLIAEGPCWVLELDLEAHESLDGVAGRIWREALLDALREHITSADENLCQFEALRAERIQRAYDFDEAVDALGGSLSWPIRQPEHVARVRAQALEILRRLAPHRRLLPGSEPCSHTPCEECFALHLPKVERFVATNRPVHFILPAFPAKSPNTESKVLGKLPDMAEEQSLYYLQAVCDSIAEVYPPGGRVTICSDGRVFSDLVLVSDEEITTYGEAIEEMIARLGFRSIDTFNLEDLFEVTTFEGMRDHLAVHYGDSLDFLRDRAREHGHHRSMFNGIHRFLFEDTVAVEKDKSRTRIRKECAGRAYEVIQRSNAFSRLIAECFPNAMRLSIHPQPPHVPKVGILLGQAAGCWITPWHGVAMKDKDGWWLVKRATAERAGATLIEVDGRPSHYLLEN